MKILWIYFLGVNPNWSILRGHVYAFQGFFFRSRYKTEDIFGVAKISNIFRVLKIPDIFFFLGGGGRTIDTGPEPTHIEQMRVPPGLAAY